MHVWHGALQLSSKPFFRQENTSHHLFRLLTRITEKTMLYLLQIHGISSDLVRCSQICHDNRKAFALPGISCLVKEGKKPYIDTKLKIIHKKYTLLS